MLKPCTAIKIGYTYLVIRSNLFLRVSNLRVKNMRHIEIFFSHKSIIFLVIFIRFWYFHHFLYFPHPFFPLWARPTCNPSRNSPKSWAPETSWSKTENSELSRTDKSNNSRSNRQHQQQVRRVEVGLKRWCWMMIRLNTWIRRTLLWKRWIRWIQTKNRNIQWNQ